MPQKPGIIVLCTGNSCRSQIAEAFLRQRLGNRFAVYSAGTEPAERVHPLTVEVMRERGFDLAGQQPQHVRRYLGVVPIHTVIIVCDGANRTCPAIWPGAWERLFWPFEDPATAVGSEASRRQKFRQVRDAIEAKVAAWAEGQLRSA